MNRTLLTAALRGPFLRGLSKLTKLITPKRCDQEHFPHDSYICPGLRWSEEAQKSSSGDLLYREDAKDYLRCLRLHGLFLELGLDRPHRSLAKRGHTAGLPTQRHSNGRWGLQA